MTEEAEVEKDVVAVAVIGEVVEVVVTAEVAGEEDKSHWLLAISY
jgi:hypothetical protein